MAAALVVIPAPISPGHLSARCTEVLRRLEALARPDQKAGQASFGIKIDNAYGGIPVPTLRALSKELGKDHALAQELWTTGIYEARELAAMVDDSRQVTEEQMERWVKDFDS